MTERRRHRLIWSAVACAHAMALGAVWIGGMRGAGEPSAEGGHILVTLLPEPVALPGEAKEGAALGAGLALPVTPAFVPAPPAAVPVATVPAAAPVASVASATAEPKGVSVAPPAPVAEVFVPPAFRARQEPAYPERARRAGVAGVVGVRIALAADGTVRRVELTASSGSRLLDEAALEAARASTFEPATRNRAPVESEAVANYRFELR
ncbi:MAG: energy transducer TonB [Opitutales bacterium]